MNNLYVCNTLYHILIAIIKLNKNEKNTIMIMNNIINENQYNRLIKIKLFDNVILDYDKNYGFKNILLNKTPYSRSWFKKFNNIYVTSEEYSIGLYLYRVGLKYHLLEDGYNLFKFPITQWQFNLKDKINAALKFKVVKNSYGPCIDIEVNDKNGIYNEKRENKFIEVSRKKLFQNLDVEVKNKIMYLFNLEKIDKLSGENNILILTQPLYKNPSQLFKTKDEQLLFFKFLMLDFKNYNIFLKPHPRDNVDYSTLNCNILNKDTPIELLEIVNSVNFDIGVTLYSTSLDFLSCVKNKIFILKRNQIERF